MSRSEPHQMRAPATESEAVMAESTEMKERAVTAESTGWCERRAESTASTGATERAAQYESTVGWERGAAISMTVAPLLLRLRLRVGAHQRAEGVLDPLAVEEMRVDAQGDADVAMSHERGERPDVDPAMCAETREGMSRAVE